MTQVRKDICHREPRFAVGRQRRNLHVRMRRNQAYQFCAGVAACAKNNNLMSHCKIPYYPTVMRRMRIDFNCCLVAVLGGFESQRPFEKLGGPL